jgi:hypothetical protein
MVLAHPISKGYFSNYVVIVREVIDTTIDKPESTRMKKEEAEEPEIDVKPTIKEKKCGRPGQKATKKRSFSVANADEAAAKPEDLPSPAALLDYALD